MTAPNAPAVTLMPIFATPFAEVALPVSDALNESLAALLAARATEEGRDASARRDPLCYVSREDLFEWQEEPVAVLRGELMAGICPAIQASTLYTEAEFDQLGVQARARFVVIRPDGCLPVQSLALASWCAIYCVAAPPAPATRTLSGVLRLYESRLGGMFADGTTWRMRPPFGDGHHLWRPKAGSMAVFPAHLAHEIALNRTDRELLLIIARMRFANPGQQAAPPW